MEEEKVIIGNNKLTNEEVKANEDFSQLLKKHQLFVKKRNWKIGGLVAAGVFLIVALVLFFTSKIKTKNETKQNTVLVEKEKGITPVLGLALEKKDFVINTEKPNVLNYNNTVIEIPEQAFVDSNGVKISGEVSIIYKDFHTPVDFFLSGIPMTYDSAGTQYHFESAGMFELRGEQNGVPVILEKPIVVKMASQQNGDYFNKYYYDEKLAEWQFISKDKITLSSLPNEVEQAELEKDLKKTKKEIKKIEQRKPNKKSAESICIKLEMDSSEFPQFRGFKDVLFEIDKSDNNFSEELAKVEWDDIKLKEKNEVFELLFYKKFKKTTLRTKPVFEGENYKKAMAIYLSENKKELDSLTKEQDRLIGSISQFNNEVRSFSDLGGFVTRIFEINNFGIFNSDYPCRMPKGQMIAAEYIEKSEKVKKDTLILKQLYLVEENKNVMYTLFTNGTLSYNPNNKCVLWGVTKDDKLVICKAKDFAKIPLNHKGIYNLEFEVIKKDLYAEEKIKKELDIDALF